MWTHQYTRWQVRHRQETDMAKERWNSHIENSCTADKSTKQHGTQRLSNMERKRQRWQSRRAKSKPAALWSRSKPMWSRRSSQTCLIKPKYMRRPRWQQSIKREAVGVGAKKGKEVEGVVTPPQTEDKKNVGNKIWAAKEQMRNKTPCWCLMPLNEKETQTRGEARQTDKKVFLCFP